MNETTPGATPGATPPARQDPIRDRFFRAVEQSEVASRWLLWIALCMSLASFLLSQERTLATIRDVVQIAFLVVVGAVFVLSLVSRLYWTPRAEDERRRDFFTNAYGIDLTHNRTVGYYNNDQVASTRRAAANVLENCLFTKTIAERMARQERIRIVAYAVVLVVVVLYRGSSVGLITIVAQTVLSEQILSHWLRIEWLRGRSEQAYEAMHDLFRLVPAGSEFDIKASQIYVLYETSKASAGITLSSRIFEQVNPSLSKDWERIRQSLKI